MFIREMGLSPPQGSSLPQPLSGWEQNGSEPRFSVQLVPIGLLVLPESQPRRYFDEAAMQQLTASVSECGIIQPLLVRPVGDKYEIVAGERRYRAAIAAQLTIVPVTVWDITADRALQYALVENLQRCDLNPVEETEGILQLLAIKLNCSVEEAKSLLYRMQNQAKGKTSTHNVIGKLEAETVQSVFDFLGRMSWDSFVINRLPLLKLQPEILQALRRGEIEYTKAKAIARVKDDALRGELLSEAITEHLSLSDIKKRIREHKALPQPSEPSLRSQMQSALAEVIKLGVWDDPEPPEELSGLLAQIQTIISRWK